MDENRASALRFKPVIMKDKLEPFEITAMGYTVFRKTERSDSFPDRMVEVDGETVKYAVEYAVWYDYDIQHLYELEHLWVFVGGDENVVRVEGSFHGKYLNMINLDTGKPMLEAKTHPIAYTQPGKHAMIPDPRVVRLIPGWQRCCLEEAGNVGVLVKDIFQNQIHTNDRLQEMTEQYIRDNYGFRPSMEFEPFRIEDSGIITWEELKATIPLRVNRQIEIIKSSF